MTVLFFALATGIFSLSHFSPGDNPNENLNIIGGGLKGIDKTLVQGESDQKESTQSIDTTQSNNPNNSGEVSSLFSFAKISNPSPSFENYAYINGDLLIKDTGILRIKPNSVNSTKIKNRSIKAEDLDSNSVTSRIIDDGTIQGEDISKDTNITFQDLNLSGVLDLGTNTIYDQNFTGDWNFNGGDLTTIGTLNVGATTLSGNLNMQNNLILNIGHAGTDFDASGGLTLAGQLTVNGTLIANSNFTLGDDGETGSIDSSDWNIDTTGAITNATYEGLTITTTTGTFTLTNGKTLSVSDSATLANSAITLGNSKALTLSDSATLNTATLTLGNGKILTLSDSTTLSVNAITFAGTEVLTLAATKDVTFADAFTTSGAFPITLNSTASTNIILPTTGTLISTDQTVGQTIGVTGARLTKLWATNIESTNAPTVSGSAVYYTGGTDVSLADGGTNASLTASNGGIFYSTGTAGAILSGTATANKILMSGSSTAPSWSTPTYPNTATNGNLIMGNGTNWVDTVVPTWNQSTTGTATYATNVATTTKADAVDYYLTFVGSNSSSNQGMDVGPATYNPSTGKITASLIGDISGNSATVTNGLYSTGTYNDPTWLNQLSGLKITSNISYNSANVTGTVSISNGGTGQTTAQAARNALLPTQATNANKFLQTDGTDATWQNVLWSSLGAPTANLSLAMQSYTTTLTYGATTGVANLFNITDTVNNTGTGYLVNITTANPSLLKPFAVSGAGGVFPAINVDSAGKVGIGWATPASQLTVVGGATFGATYATDVLTDGKVAIENNLGIGTTAPLSKLDINGDLRLRPLTTAPTVQDGNVYYDGNDKNYKMYNTQTAGYIDLVADPHIQPSECPTGYVPVPGDARYGTAGGFCVMKYEAKCDDDADGEGDTTAQDATYKTWHNDTTACTGAGKAVVSSALGAPIAYISQITAKAYCSALGTGYHLITNNEWMTMARNIDRITSNWTSGTVGTAGIWRGHTDGTPNNALEANTDDAQGYEGTGQSAPSIEKRTFTLSNSQIVWDLSGNVWEWNQDTIKRKDEPHSTTAPDNTFNYKELNTFDNYGTMSYAAMRPSNPAWTSAHNMGRVYTYNPSGDTNTTQYAFIRGGGWYATSNAGLFLLNLSYTPTDTGYNIGFRCVFQQ